TNAIATMDDSMIGRRSGRGCSRQMPEAAETMKSALANLRTEGFARSEQPFCCPHCRIGPAWIAMDEHKHHGAFREQHDLSCTVARRENSRCGKFIGEPFFDGSLVFPGNRPGRVAAQVGEFDHGTRYASSRIFRLPRPITKFSEITLNQLIAGFNRLAELSELFECQLAGVGKRGCH